MRKMYSALATALLLMVGYGSTSACQYSDFNLVSETDLGGGLYEYTVTFCVGNGPTSNGNTLLWAVALDNGATFSSYPATLTSPATGAVYQADNVSYGPGLLIFENYANGGWDGAWACTDAACGSLLQVCETFTFITSGHPNSMTLMGAQGDGVGVAPYGCNGDADLVINLQSMTVDAGTTVYHCLGACANLSATITGGAAPYTYLWEALGATSTVGTTPNITVCTTGNEVYKLTVTDDNGLISHDFVSVVVSAPPTVSAGADKDIYIGYGASCVSLDGYANNSMGPYGYSWSNGSTAKTPSVCPTSTTNYTLTVCDSRGCIATDDVTVNVTDITCGNNKVLMCKNGRTICVRTNKVQAKFNRGFVLGGCGSNKWESPEDYLIVDEDDLLQTAIYPNPAADLVSIKYGFDADVTVNMDMYDMSGRKVQALMTNQAVFEYESNTSTFSIAEHQSGLYIIVISTSNGDVQTHRLMVNH